MKKESTLVGACVDDVAATGPLRQTAFSDLAERFIFQAAEEVRRFLGMLLQYERLLFVRTILTSMEDYILHTVKEAERIFGVTIRGAETPMSCDARKDKHLKKL